MEINDAARTSRKAGLDEGIVLSKVGRDDVARRGVASQELPADGKTEDVEAIIVDEVLHLPSTVRAVVLGQRWPRCTGRTVTVGVASEVEAGDVDTGELELACAGWGAVCWWSGAADDRCGDTGVHGDGEASRRSSRGCDTGDALRVVCASVGLAPFSQSSR